MSGPPKSESAARRGAASAQASRIAQHWRGGVLVGVTVGALAFAATRLLPTKYESTALVEVTSQPGSVNEASESVASEIRKVTLDRVRIDDDGSGEAPASARAEDTISIEAASDHTFSLSFRASTAQGAQKSCGELADAVVAHFGKGSNNAAREDLQRHTKELADFVSQHPDAFLEAPTPPATPREPRPTAPADPALAVLRQQKASLEAELGKAEAEAAAAPHEANPYDDATEHPKIADIARQLAEVRQALIAHQREVSRRAGSAPSGSPQITPAAPTKASLQEERQRLVHAVLEAQQVSASAPQRKMSSAGILQPPSLPTIPIKPNRWLVRLVPLVLGIWAGLLWAVIRVVQRQNRVPRRHDPTRAIGMGFPPDAAFRTVSTLPPRSRTPYPDDAALALKAALAPPPVPALGPGPSPTPPGTAPAEYESSGPRTVPNAVMAGQIARSDTMLGMMDPALVRTQIGGTPLNLLGQKAPAGQAPNATSGRTLIVEETSEARAGAERPSSDAPPAQRAAPPAPPAPPAQQAAPQARNVSSNPPRAVMRSSPGEPKATERRSSKPPRPVVRMPSEPAKGPETRPAGTLTSARDESPFAAPVTQRFGYGDPNEPKTLSPPPPPPSLPPRPDRSPTSYSFVDQSRRSKAPPPVAMDPPDQPGRRSIAPDAFEGTAPERRVPMPSQYPKADVRPPLVAERPVVEAEIVERVPVVQAAPARGKEAWTRVIEAPAGESDDIVAPRSVPTSWRIRPNLEVNGQAGRMLSSLSDQVRKIAAQGCFVVAVVGEYSVLEAKSFVSARLSTMLANGENRKRVLLLEANFDFPAVHRILGVDMPGGGGFSQQLRSRIRGNGRGPWKVMRCTDTLHVLAEGVVRSPGILLSREFANAIVELRNAYDVIIIDGPITGLAVETKPIDDVCDGVAVVAGSGVPIGETLERTQRWFSHKQLFAAIPADGGA